MIYRVDLTKPIWRYLYHEIYDRIYTIGIENNVNEQDIINRILRLQTGDSKLYLLVELRDNSISSHGLVNILNTVAFIEQVNAERKKDNTFVYDLETYIQTVIKQEHPEITKMVFGTKRDEYRAFERKYGFTVMHILMEKEIKPVSLEIQEGI